MTLMLWNDQVVAGSMFVSLLSPSNSDIEALRS